MVCTRIHTFFEQLSDKAPIKITKKAFESLDKRKYGTKFNENGLIKN